MSAAPSVLLVGTGPMARDYARLFREGLSWPFVVASRQAATGAAFAAEHGAAGAVVLDELAEGRQKASQYDLVVIASAIDALSAVTTSLLAGGAKKVLVEKPAALDVASARAIAELAKSRDAFVRVAYNRRYYASVRRLREILRSEAPVCATFDFTEWPSSIGALDKPAITKARWALGNSAHVFDTMFHLLGPMSGCVHRIEGKGVLEWHPSGATYVGTAALGTTPVSWATSWQCPGRWNIEVMTALGRYKLSPMEQLQVVRHRSVQWSPVEIDDALDKAWKPGLHRMVTAFKEAALDGGACDLPDAAENATTVASVCHVVGYEG